MSISVSLEQPIIFPKDQCEQSSAELMRQFQFEKYRKYKVHDLSGGTKQKLNLSLSLLQNPQLLLLDEPYAGFDWATYQSFMNYTKKALKEGKCIVMVSHMVHEMHLFDAVSKLDNGVLYDENTCNHTGE